MRIISIAILITITILSIGSSEIHALSSLVISHPDSIKHRGNTNVLISISLKNVVPYAGSEFCISYDARRLYLNRIESAERLSGQSDKGYYEYADGKVAAVIFDIAGQSLSADSGSIFNAYFDVRDDAPDGQADISISEATAVIPDLTYDTLDVTNGYIIVQEETSVGGGDDNPLVSSIRFVLGQNYPNPFNPSTRIEYAIERPCRVKIMIFNVAGQRVRTLVDEDKAIGEYAVVWDGKNDSGVKASTGVYFYKIFADKYRNAKKMILLR